MKKERKDILDTFAKSFPLLEKIYDVYNNSEKLSKDQENTLRRSIEVTTLEILELTVVASRQSIGEKVFTLRNISNKIDTIKVFIELAYQTSHINEEDYTGMIEKVNNVGKMVYGWGKSINEKINEN